MLSSENQVKILTVLLDMVDKEVSIIPMNLYFCNLIPYFNFANRLLNGSGINSSLNEDVLRLWQGT